MIRTLTLEELAPYLPYGLNFILTEDIRDYFVDEFWQDDTLVEKGAIWRLIGLNKIENGTPSIQVGDGELCKYLFTNDKDNTFASFTEGCKPLLRNLSDLTKEIEHNGKRFVPMDELAKLVNLNTTYYELRYEYRHITLFDRADDVHMINDNNFFMMNKLFEWHFDIFGLIESSLAIDINTVQQ